MFKKTCFKSLSLLAIIHLFFVITAEARWAEPEEAAVEYEMYNRDITVKKDNSEEIVECRIKILNERGRESYGVFRNFFNQNIQKIEIIEAKSSHEGLDYAVPEKNIEIKPIASELNGFDQMMLASITFPNVSIGSTVYIKFKVTTFKQPLPNYFSRTFYLGQDGVVKQSNISIKSELPLHILLNDPRQKLVMQESKTGKIQTISIRLKEGVALYEDLANESSNSFLPDDLLTRVMVSTFDSFEEFAKASAANFQNTINEPLPPMLEEIKKEAQTTSTLIDQINIVTSKLSEKIRYLTDKTTIEGRFSPRTLKATVESAVGDCKDFSAATVAILRALGHKANVALVIRGDWYLTPKKLLPSIECSNHAMVKVITKDSKVLWIDPTNTVSLAGGLFPDIANRPAIVLDSEHPSYEYIPEVDSLHAQTIIESEIALVDELQHVKGKITTKGEDALSLAGWTLYQSEQAIKERIIKKISGETTPIEMDVKLPDLSIRIVPESIPVEYSFKQKNNLLLTNMGDGLTLDSPWSSMYSQVSDDEEGTIYVGYPDSVTRTTVIKNIKSPNLNNLDFSIDTPWIQASRKCEIKDGNTIIVDKAIIRKRFILPEEIKSPEFKKLKEVIKEYCQNIAIIFPKSAAGG